MSFMRILPLLPTLMELILSKLLNFSLIFSMILLSTVTGPFSGPGKARMISEPMRYSKKMRPARARAHRKMAQMGPPNPRQHGKISGKTLMANAAVVATAAITIVMTAPTRFVCPLETDGAGESLEVPDVDSFGSMMVSSSVEPLWKFARKILEIPLKKILPLELFWPSYSCYANWP
jgi:hypothetical protein